MKDSFSPLFSQNGPWNSVSVEWWQFRHFFVRNYSFSLHFPRTKKKKKNVCFVARGNRIPLFIWHAFPRLLSSRQPATWNYLASNFLPFFFFFFFFFRTHRCKWKHFPVDTFVTCSFLLTRERNVVMNCDHCVFSHFQPRYVVQILTVSHSSCIH